MQQVYTDFLRNSLSHLLRQANRISSDFGRGYKDMPVYRLQELKRTCDEVSNLITAVIAQRCTVEECGQTHLASIGDKTRQFPKLLQARKWIVRALCGRR